MLTQPTPEMTAALQAFADRNGRHWKDKLSTLWANGRDYYEPEGAELHSVRNELGPSWLWDRCKIKPAPRAKPAKRVHLLAAGYKASGICGLRGQVSDQAADVTCPSCQRMRPSAFVGA